MRSLRDFGFGKKSMENLILEEVHDLISWIKKNEKKAISVNKKFNLSVVNALWMIMAGHRYDHDDTKHTTILNEANEYLRKNYIINTYIISHNYYSLKPFCRLRLQQLHQT